MAHSIFVALFFAFLTRATVNFPCEQITSRLGYSCTAVGWCDYHYENGDYESGTCVEDTCIKTTTQSGSCDVGCSKNNRFSDWDCMTDTYVNESGFYCYNGSSYLSECFYNGTLTGGSCGKGCKNVTLGGKTACIEDYDYDDCNDFDSEDLCHFTSVLCYWQNGKCVKDLCLEAASGGPSTLDCFPHTNCALRDYYDYYNGQYYTYHLCLDPAHTTYNKCEKIDIDELVPNNTEYCYDLIIHDEYCTGQAGCKVVTFEGKSVCSSLDAPSSSSLVRMPSVFVLLAGVLALLFAP